jgi:DNA-binding NtrC family response regulator
MLRLLLVDDDMMAHKYINEFFMAEGVKPDWASSVEEAKQKLAQHSYDCVVSDINMPVETGSELAVWVKKYYPRTKMFLCSGVPELQTQKGVYDKLYCDGFIEKPVYPYKLWEKLKEAA